MTHHETAMTEVTATVEMLDTVLWIVDLEPKDPHRVQGQEKARVTEPTNVMNHLGGVQKCNGIGVEIDGTSPRTVLIGKTPKLRRKWWIQTVTTNSGCKKPAGGGKGRLFPTQVAMLQAPATLAHVCCK